LINCVYGDKLFCVRVGLILFCLRLSERRKGKKK